jgi:predicted RNA-binding Zn-ribbon protein involved in translation (DUF1610 family)
VEAVVMSEVEDQPEREGNCRSCGAKIRPERVPAGWRCPACGHQALERKLLVWEIREEA